MDIRIQTAFRKRPGSPRFGKIFAVFDRPRIDKSGNSQPKKYEYRGMSRLKPPSSAKIFETPLLTCWFGESGILYSVSKPAERTIGNYAALFELYRKLVNDKQEKLRTLGDITNTGHLDAEVREYITKELPKYIQAMALISASPLGAAIGNFFIKVHPQAYPTRIFNNAQDAVLWLKNIQSQVLIER